MAPVHSVLLVHFPVSFSHRVAAGQFNTYPQSQIHIKIKINLIVTKVFILQLIRNYNVDVNFDMNFDINFDINFDMNFDINLALRACELFFSPDLRY